MSETIDQKKDATLLDEMKILAAKKLEEVGHTIEEVSDKVVEKTAEASEKTVSTIKKYPLHTALAAGAVGLIAGAVIARK